MRSSSAGPRSRRPVGVTSSTSPSVGGDVGGGQAGEQDPPAGRCVGGRPAPDPGDQAHGLRRLLDGDEDRVAAVEHGQADRLVVAAHHLGHHAAEAGDDRQVARPRAQPDGAHAGLVAARVVADDPAALDEDGAAAVQRALGQVEPARHVAQRQRALGHQQLDHGERGVHAWGPGGPPVGGARGLDRSRLMGHRRPFSSDVAGLWTRPLTTTDDGLYASRRSTCGTRVHLEDGGDSGRRPAPGRRGPGAQQPAREPPDRRAARGQDQPSRVRPPRLDGRHVAPDARLPGLRLRGEQGGDRAGRQAADGHAEARRHGPHGPDRPGRRAGSGDGQQPGRPRRPRADRRVPRVVRPRAEHQAAPGRELEAQRGRQRVDVQDPPGRQVPRRPAA